MGTPELASVGLNALLKSDFFDISAVITKPDKSAGRNLQVIKSPVKILAEQNNIQIFQPEKLKDIYEEIQNIKPELIIVIAFGKILSPSFLDIPKYGCINVHASLLPKYRGSACIPAPILNGDKESGITIMKMDADMDTGAIIKKITIGLDSQETAISLMEKIKKTTQENLAQVIKEYIDGDQSTTPQNNDEATYVKMIQKEDGHINFMSDTAEMVERKVRAYKPWPGTYAFIEKNDLPKRKILFKILQVDNTFINSDIPAGCLFLHNSDLALKCSDKAIIIKELQLEGKKPMTAPEFLKGNSWILNAGPFV